ncbi:MULTISPECIES: PfaB family protein [Shewanella]|uniref:PfaB family protein n=1 Tax=Shewanella TaxID=22 RepID=UPI00143139E9|nr:MULTISPECIES: PfaB family protein [Shewanella]MBO2697294.1 PfaB family protein [Shewanella algae]MDC8853232.1 PfaB family protein [Shewanella algae]NJI83695.1 PfaB family protein [Shewanella sp. Iso12]
MSKAIGPMPHIGVKPAESAAEKPLRLALCLVEEEQSLAPKLRAALRTIAFDSNQVPDWPWLVAEVKAGASLSLVQPSKQRLLLLSAVDAAQARLHPQALLQALSHGAHKPQQLLKQAWQQAKRPEVEERDTLFLEQPLQLEQLCLQLEAFAKRRQVQKMAGLPFQGKSLALVFSSPAMALILSQGTALSGSCDKTALSSSCVSGLAFGKESTSGLCSQGAPWLLPLTLIANPKTLLSEAQTALQQAKSRLSQSMSADALARWLTDELKTLEQSFSGTAPEGGEYYSLALIGRDAAELIAESELLLGQLRKITSLAEVPELELITPNGSVFCAQPLGPARLCFVYPGVGTAYHGMLGALKQAFPKSYADFEAAATAENVALCTLLPTALSDISYTSALSDASKETTLSDKEEATPSPAPTMTLAEQAVAGVGASVLLTQILRREFKLRPAFAIGYSMGEAAMFAANGVWDKPFALVKPTLESRIFSEQISGALTAVRQEWQLDARDAICWNSFLLRIDADSITPLLQNPAYSRVYLAIRQGPSCVLAGDEAQCRALIKSLGKRGVAANRVTAMHTPAALRVKPELTAFYDRPLSGELEQPQPVYISAGSEQPLKPARLERKPIAETIATCFSQPLNVESLLQRARKHGAQLFLEVGADSQTSSIIQAMAGKQLSSDIKAFGCDRKHSGAADNKALLKALARLISHRVPLATAALYPQLARPDNLVT